MAATNVQAFSGDVTIPGDVTVTGETILGTATYRKRRDWNRHEKAYVYLGNVRTSSTTGIRLDVSLNNSNSGYVMNSFQITLQGADSSHAGGKLVYSVVGLHNASTLSSIDIGYVYVSDGTGLYTYQLWLKDPVTEVIGSMDAYLNCQGYYIFDTGVSDVAHGGSAPTNFNVGVPGVVCDYTGKVGIGTNVPESILHLSARTASADITDPIKIKIHNRRGAGDWSITQPWGLLEFDTDDNGTAGTGPVAGIGCRFEGNGGGDSSICFYTDNVVNDDNVLGAANERMCINSDGLVGVGTAAPRAKMDIYTGSTTTAGLILDRYGSGNYRTELYQASDGLSIHVGNASTTPSEKLLIGHNGTVTATTFSGALSGTASAATLAAASSAVTINQDYSTNASRYIPFVDGVTGNLGVSVDNGLYYNPSTQTMTTSTFAGNATSATLASTVHITADNSSNANRYITFADSNSGGYSVKADNGLYYNPSTGQMFSSIFNGTSRGHNNSTYNWYNFDTLGSDGNWRAFAGIGSTSAGIMTVVSYSAGHSQVSALWWYQYKAGGTGGYVSRLSGNGSPQFRLSGQQIQHNSGGGVHYTEARTLPLTQ
jgi:hypothetical protein